MRLDAISIVVAALLMLLPESASAGNGCEEADPGSIPIASGDILFLGYGNVTQTIVPADGKVVIPLAGEVQVLGQTPNHLAQLVRERLSKYINKNAVEIYVEDDGERNHCLREPDTVVDALDYLGVIRKFENDYKARFPWGQILRFNYKESRKAANGDQFIMIETGDPIYRPLYLRKRSRSFTLDGKLTVGGSRDNNQSAAPGLATPCVLDVRERNLIGVDAEFTAGDIAHELLAGLDPHFGWRGTAAAGPKNLQP